MTNEGGASGPARQPRRPAPDDDAAATRVLRQFRVVFNRVRTHFQQVEKSAGIGGAQLWALSVIRARPGLGVNELARSLDVHQSTASNLLRGLVERGLVAATRDEIDQRALQLRVMPAGARMLRKAPGPFTGVLPAALAGLDPATLARLEADLALLIAALQVDEHAAKTPLSQM